MKSTRAKLLWMNAVIPKPLAEIVAEKLNTPLGQRAQLPLARIVAANCCLPLADKLSMVRVVHDNRRATSPRRINLGMVDLAVVGIWVNAERFMSARN